MDYKDNNDYELISLAHESSEEAKEELVNKYTGIIYTISKKYLSIATSFGIEEKDLVQEGLIGLTKAIETYNIDKEVLFYTYATHCIESSIKTALKIASRKKNISLNNSVSLDEMYESETSNINEILRDETSDPSLQILSKEELKELIDKVIELLAPFETEVFNLRMKGYSNEEVASILGKDKRSIENTISRIRSKCKGIKK